MNTQTCLILIALIPCAAFGQTTAPQPAFEIADVHVSPGTLHPKRNRVALFAQAVTNSAHGDYGRSDRSRLGNNPQQSPGRPQLARNGPLRCNCQGAPKCPPQMPRKNTSPQALRLMLQALLAERFHLVVHPDQKPMPAFVLTVGNGKPKLKESENSGPAGCQRQPQAAVAGAIPATCHGTTMETFASLLGGAAGDYLNNPVVDNTHLEGALGLPL